MVVSYFKLYFAGLLPPGEKTTILKSAINNQFMYKKHVELQHKTAKAL